MGRKSKLPALQPSISPILDSDYLESRRNRLPPISNAPLVSTMQGRPGEPARRVRPGTGFHHMNSPSVGPYIPKPPTPHPTSDGQLPYVNNRDMVTRLPVNSQIDLTLPLITGPAYRINARLLRRQQIAMFGSETNIHRGPPNVANILPPVVPNLTIHGQRICTPCVRSPCEGMEDPASDFSSELKAISMGDTDSQESTSRPQLCQSEVPPLNLHRLRPSRRSPPRVLTPRDLPDFTSDDLNSPSQSMVPKLPLVKKHKKRIVKDDQL